ncbi:hypothetical protein BDF20DRAFT_408017 [Mycotypha africana]|uniref:uncharacterized protein n=1 Tax=Mycotypha africana TaxID=64632 RepID=UPI0023002373|nr:uncharacterized protein BDF20DRAFT_408017 [Mycotypha africana]KAI8984768.1 hypothetical protein BDF20DRAFT_408017 [Mycotypha africana]
MTSIVNKRTNTNSSVDKAIFKPCPSRTECQCAEFYAPEGTYTLLHDIFFETIQPQFDTGTHVSFFSSLNELAPNAPFVPCIKPCQASLPLSISDLQHPPDHSFSSCTNTTSTGTNDTLIEEESDQREEDNDPILTTDETTIGSAVPTAIAKEFLEHNNSSTNNIASTSSGSPSFSSFFSNSSKQQQKHKRPKSSLSKLKSNFIENVTLHDHFAKLTSTVNQHIFFNVGSSLLWMEEDPYFQRPKEIISRLTFGKSYITCHNVNSTTSKLAEHINLVIGFSTGDLLWAS